ncbi:MAG: VanZ family protein [Gemmatimonadota bacterium]
MSSSTSDDPAWTRRASPLARALFTAYLLLVIYASLSPWSGWRSIGVGPLAFLTAPLPRYITTFDIVVNMLGYLPLGALAVLALHPRLRGAGAVALATFGCVLVSGTMEALQTFLPARISSSIDLATNSAGALLGALLAAPNASSLIDRGRLAQLRARWFRRDATVPLTLVALWPIAQLHPGPMLFGNGEMRELLQWILEPFGGLPTWSGPDRFGPAEFILDEAMVCAAGLLAAGLSLAAIMQAFAPRVPLLLALAAAALGAKSLALGVEFGAERAFAWSTPGAIGGLVIGILALLVGSAGRPRAIARLALLSTLATLVLVNLTPENPYHAHWLQQWHPGRLLHAAAAAEWLATAWPYAMLIWLATAAFSARLPNGRPTVS